LPFLSFPVTAQGAQRQPALPAELDPAQSARLEFCNYLLDLMPAPPALPYKSLFFIHAPTSSGNSLGEKMVSSDAYLRL
jgi:hypothetical protein